MTFYKSMSDSFMVPASHYIDKNWVEKENSNVFKRHVAARGGHLAMLPFSVLTTVLDTIIGVGGGIAALVTAGTQKTILNGAAKHLRNSRLMLALPFKEILLTINPSAIFSSSLDTYSGNSRLGNGIFADIVLERLETDHTKLAYSTDPFLEHVGSRLFSVVSMVSMVAARVIDFAIGLVAAPLALITFGKFNLLNVLAFRGLQVTGIINDLFRCAILIINPTV